MPVFLPVPVPVFVAFQPPARLADTKNTKQQVEAKHAILAAYKTVDAAFMRRDTQSFFAVFQSDAVLVSNGQKTTANKAKADFTAFMPQWTGDLKQTTTINRWSFTTAPSQIVLDTQQKKGPPELRLSPTGPQTVVVLVTQTVDGTFQKQKTHFVAQSRDTWRKTSVGWRIAKSETLKEDVTMVPLAPTITDAEQKAVLSEIRTRLVPLATVEAGHGFDDLAPIGNAIGNARIVSLGEASHGTREFFQMKHRLLKYLVKEKGFTVFAIEANFPEVLAVDKYIKTGEGDAKTALAKTYFWTWYTQEVLDMIEWMRAYNKTRPNGSPALTFTGFDMQTAEVAAKHAQSFLQKASPNDAKTTSALYARVLKTNEDQKANRSMTSSGDAYKPTVVPAETVLALFDNNRDAYVKATTQSEYDLSRQCALVVVQAQKEGRAASFVTMAGQRDAAMAQNVRWLASTAHPNEKIVLWAHNGHVGLQTYGGGIKSMGMHLKEMFGAEMVVVGFAFNRGQIRAVPMSGGKMTGPAQPLPVTAAKPGTGDALLALAHQPRFFLDLHNVPSDGPLGKWLAIPQLFRMPGAAWDASHADNFASPTKVSEMFDGIIFIDESHASQALGPRSSPKKAVAK